MVKKSLIADPLRAIRSALGVSRSSLGERCGLSAVYVEMLENKTRQGSLEAVSALASALCCTPADLLSTPTPERLRDIKIAYKRRELAQLEGDKHESEVA